MIIDDQEQNYTISQNEALGMNVPEQVFLHLIGFAFQKIADGVDSPDNIVDQLFPRLPPDTRKSIKAWIRDHRNINICINWPREDTNLPCIAIITESEDEEDAMAMLGDYAGTHVLGSYGGPETARDNYKIGLSNITSIFIAADDPNLTLYLGSILRFIFLRNKLSLQKTYNIIDLAVSQADLKWDERFLPTFAYMRNVSLRYKTYFDINVSEKTSLITSLDLLVATNSTITDVSPEPAPAAVGGGFSHGFSSGFQV